MMVPDYLQEDIVNFLKAHLKGDDSLYEEVTAEVGLAFVNGHFEEKDKYKLYQFIDSIKNL